MKAAEQVFAYWRARQRSPDRCKLTQGRRKLIERALKDYEPDELNVLTRYAYEANEPGPKFWRGDSREGRTYLDITNLLSDAARLPGRVEAALEWLDTRKSAADSDVGDDPTAMLIALARRAPGKAAATATTEAPKPPWRRKKRPEWG